MFTTIPCVTNTNTNKSWYSNILQSGDQHTHQPVTQTQCNNTMRYNYYGINKQMRQDINKHIKSTRTHLPATQIQVDIQTPYNLLNNVTETKKQTKWMQLWSLQQTAMYHLPLSLLPPPNLSHLPPLIWRFCSHQRALLPPLICIICPPNIFSQCTNWKVKVDSLGRV